MKPYALSDDKYDDIGCCPGHDYPPTRKYSGTYKSRRSKHSKAKIVIEAKRLRRHRDKYKLIEELSAFLRGES